ncbi:hypothetical protein RB7409 [Rhodopirellula baltica SH 1]|uniref:Uncharacterized protein n=1 Tax=Rhodopirellula baltica (strain DSM 10527 / NCIMB 13988 / SH1) TaxID=243090 RepID=Q7UNS3_RHOBA|nr:hypothetical protein RB7409 [Rhodopirellula baltica SH 1]
MRLFARGASLNGTQSSLMCLRRDVVLTAPSRPVQIGQYRSACADWPVQISLDRSASTDRSCQASEENHAWFRRWVPS